MNKNFMKSLHCLAWACILGLLLGACSTAGMAINPSEPLQIPASPHPPQTLEPIIPASPIPTPSPAAIFAGPGPQPTPEGCKKVEGSIRQGSLKTSLLREPLEFRLYLPACYDQATGKRYPVLYLIHGQSYTDDQWDRLGADEIADRLIAAGQIAPLIMVMPRDREWTQPDEDRFGDAVQQVLVPWVDRQFRTLTGRPYRAVGGISRGAGWAVHLGLSDWQEFGAIGTHSLPIFWTDTYYIKTWLSAIPPESLPRIYLDIGNNDRPEILTSAVWFENLLTNRNIPHEWHLFTGYHEEKYWQSHMEQYILWYSEGWKDLLSDR